MRFARGLTAGILVPLLIVGLFNFIVDPYQLGENRIAGFNDVFSFENFLGESAIDNAIRAYSKGSDSTVSLIGTSHVALGVSTIDNPLLEKIALRGLTLNEGFEIAQSIIDKSTAPRTILIELGSTRENQRGERLGFRMRYLQIKTTVESIRMIRRSIRAKNQPGEFVAEKDLKEFPREPELSDFKERVIDYLRENTKVLGSQISGLKDKGVKHKIIFFTSPLPAQVVDQFQIRDLVDSSYLKMSQFIEEANKKNEYIEFGFVGVLGSTLGSEYLPWTESFHDGWYDFNHYKPVIGEQLLEYLMNKANNDN